MPDIFISYASQTRPDAKRAAEAMRKLGYEVWLDDQLPPHRAYSEVIEERISGARGVLVLWSESAVQSQWVRAEADFARTHGKLVQATLDGVLPPMPFNQVQCADFTRWNGDARDAEWLKVVSSLAEIVAREPAENPPSTVVPPRARFRPPLAALVAAAIVVVLIAGALLAWRFGQSAQATVPLKVAVLPFGIDGDAPELRTFASGLLDETLSALRSGQVQALSRTDSLALRGGQANDAMQKAKVTFFLDGAVSRVGNKLKVKVFLNDTRDHTTLWSAEIERAAAEAEALQAQVAARCADVLLWAAMSRRDGGARMDSATLSAFIDANDQLSTGGQTAEKEIREVIAKSPGFSQAHSKLAMLMRPVTPDESIGQLSADRRKEADLALKLDPHNGEAYVALWGMAPSTDWIGQEALLKKGVVADPSFAPLWRMYDKFLGRTGRFNQGLSAARRAAELNYMLLGSGVDLCDRLTLAHSPDAAESCQRADRLWPGVGYNDMHQFFLEVGDGRDGAALKRLTNPDLTEEFGAEGVAVWSRLLRARIKHDSAGARAAGIEAGKLADIGKLDRRLAYVALALTDRVEPALRLGASMFQGGGAPRMFGLLDTSILFMPATASVRRDPRFMDVARALKLTDYWIASGKWPDFCSDPGLGYDCRKSAA